MNAISLNSETGWLNEVTYVKSPNYNKRPFGIEINLLVIHNISLPPNEFGGAYIDAFFTNTLDPTVHPYFASIAHLKVSSHCLINREGNITQYVSFRDRAWHAGESTFAGVGNCNDYSIGIELEGADDIPYTEAQYVTLSRLTKLLQSTYPTITKDRIVGHNMIAPTRKTDPGPLFDWKFYTKLI